MELTIKKTSGILGLIEFRTPEKSTIYFENDFGMIKEQQLMFNQPDFTFCLNEVEDIELIETKHKLHPHVNIALTAFVLALVVLSWSILMVMICFITILLLAAYNRYKSYDVKITLIKEEEKHIHINKKRVSDVKAYIQQYYKYKQLKR